MSDCKKNQEQMKAIIEKMKKEIQSIQDDVCKKSVEKNVITNQNV